MTIDTTNASDLKAIKAVADSGQWLKVRGSDGRALAYGIESATTPGVYHFANSTQCTCPAGQNHRRCWHTTAVSMHVASLRAQQAAKDQERFANTYGRIFKSERED